jgi:DNA-binding MarR family transcriptional regulator
MPSAAHLAAFASMLSGDEDTSAMHLRELQIIALLVAHEVPLSVGMVATMLSISQSHISRVADKLVIRKLIVRVESPTDRRIVLLEPTPAGRSLDAQVRAHYRSAQPATV